VTVGDRLVVHTRSGVIEVVLTGDAKTDALLERWAARGGGVIRGRGELAIDPTDLASALSDREAA